MNAIKKSLSKLTALSYAGEAEGGADTVEYVVVLSIATAIGLVLYTFRGNIVTWANSVSDDIDSIQ